MSKTLYRVVIEHEVYVMAESEDEAINVACSGIEEHGDDPRDEDAQEVVAGQSVPPQWKNAIPFGSDDEATVADLIARMKPKETRE